MNSSIITERVFDAATDSCELTTFMMPEDTETIHSTLVASGLTLLITNNIKGRTQFSIQKPYGAQIYTREYSTAGSREHFARQLAEFLRMYNSTLAEEKK